MLQRRSSKRRCGAIAALLLACGPAAAEAQHYEARYRAEMAPASGVIRLHLQLAGTRLPSKVVLHIDPRRHREFSSTDSLEVEGSTVTWRPRGETSQLRYEFVVDNERAPKRYDSLMTGDWAIFRGDRLVPRSTVTAARGLESRARLEFVLPQGWSVATPYAGGAAQFDFDEPGQRFDRPKGWMLAGKIGTRAETIGGIHTMIAAPAGEGARRQDTLAFLNWNLPHLVKVFPDFPQRLLIVSGDDPMWRGGLSGPASLFLHASRPLISENRTSPLLHELVHVAMGIRGDEESDWIAEGMAEFYSIETLRRSGGISQRRHDEALARLEDWGRRAPTLFAKRSSGPVTARAVIALRAADEEIRAATGGRAGLDDVARELAARRGEVSLKRLQSVAEKIAGRPLETLERKSLEQH